MTRAGEIVTDDDAILRAIATHGTPTRHVDPDHTMRWCTCWTEAMTVLRRIRAMPVEQRMEAMGMEQVGMRSHAVNGPSLVSLPGGRELAPGTALYAEADVDA